VLWLYSLVCVEGEVAEATKSLKEGVVVDQTLLVGGVVVVAVVVVPLEDIHLGDMDWVAGMGRCC